MRRLVLVAGGKAGSAPFRQPPQAGRRPPNRTVDRLRLVPLAGFHWGRPMTGTMQGDLPRVRNDHVLIRISEGITTIRFPRHDHVLGSQQLAFLPAGTAFSLRPSANVQGEVILIPLIAARHVSLPHEFRSGLPESGDVGLLRPALQRLEADTSAVDPLPMIAAILSRLRPSTAQPTTADGAFDLAKDLVDRFLNRALADLGNSPSIAELARGLDCSQGHLDRACKLVRGRNALQLLYDLRLQTVRQALACPEPALPQLAKDLGFADMGHFIRAFQAATGQTPAAYRQQCLQAKGSEGAA